MNCEDRCEKKYNPKNLKNKLSFSENCRDVK